MTAPIPPASDSTTPSDTGSATGHPYRTAPAPRPFDPDGARVPYDGQARMRLTISSGLADARISIDPDARDLLAIECGDGPRPRLELAGEELALIWRPGFGGWLRDMLAPGLGAVVSVRSAVEIVLHPAVEWTLEIGGGLSRAALDLAAGKVSGIDLAGGCSHVLIDLPPAAAVVPVHVSGGAVHLGLRRPAETGVGLDVAGGIAKLRLDEWSLDAIGGVAQLNAGDVTGGAPHYQLTIAGGACDLSIDRR
jgi:hypothetical protein